MEERHDWIQNLSVAIALLGMGFIAKLAPLFGAMYEGLGSRLPLIAQFIYHPAIYVGFPVLVLFVWLAANLAHYLGSFQRSVTLKATIAFSLLYLVVTAYGMYLPYQKMASALDEQARPNHSMHSDGAASGHAGDAAR